MLGAEVLLVAAVVAGQLAGSTAEVFSWADFMPVGWVTFTAIGAVVVPRRPRNPVGWLFLAIGGVSGLSVLGASYGSTRVGAWLYAWAPAIAYGMLPLVLLLFPDGVLPSPRWRPVAWFALITALTTAAGIATAALQVPGLLAVRGPLPNPPPPALVIGQVGLVCIVVAFIAATASIAVRWRRADGVARQQLKWLGLGAAPVPFGVIAQAFEVPGAWVVAAVTIPVAAGIAILRFYLYDADLVINRSLVYLILTAIVLGGYTTIVVALGALFAVGETWQRILAAGLVALAFTPLRERVQHAANRLLYGDRDNPYAVLSGLSRRLERSVDPGTVLPQVVIGIADALHLPYAAIELADATRDRPPVIAHGRLHGVPEAFRMTHQGEVVGRLLVCPRTSGQRFNRTEQTLLEDLARQAGAAARTVRLHDDLRRSRERLVRSREEERRRLRRDLHDGLGPALAGMTMQVGAARALLPGAPARVEPLLSDLERQLQDCIADIRRLVDDLRPSTLDQLGLVGAIRQHAAAFAAAVPGSAPVIEVTAPEVLRELPAAVEVAAYRIAAEAMTNIVRHARAGHADVTLSVADGLVLEVVDDGIGLPADPVRAGVGLTSMRERSAELGGSLVIERPAAGGTRIQAVLPLDPT